MDLKGGKDGLTDEEFKKKYGKTKQEVRKEMQNKPEKAEPVSEAKLDEEDIIVIPGQGRKMKTGFVPHGKSRVDHEVEMAKSDLLQLLKNTQTVMMCIKDKSEDEGLEGWVQEKIIKSADYMNTIAEYLEGKRIKEEIKTGGVIAGGGVGESRATYGPVTDAHKASSKKVFAAGVKDGKAGAEKNKQHMASALMKTTYLNGYKQGAKEGKIK
jgi:hypothetical protein